MLRLGHQGPIVVVSRRGLVPRPQGPVLLVLANIHLPGVLDALPGGVLLDRMANPVPEFLVQAEWQDWFQPFDKLHDCLRRLWPQLPVPEKRPILRRLSVWYDEHRFRTVPHTDDWVQQACARGWLVFRTARVHSVRPRHHAAYCKSNSIALHLLRLLQRVNQTPDTEDFEAVVNCTGLDSAAGMAANPLLATLIVQGHLRLDDCQLGLTVNAHCCALNAGGHAQPICV